MEYLVSHTGHKEHVNFHRVAMNDQMDGKALLGSYSCHNVPGQFAWRNGVITEAAINGHWLLIEDVDQAPPDVLSALEPLIFRRELHILSRGMIVKAHPGFHLFITTRSSLGDMMGLRLAQPSLQLEVIVMPQWTEQEMTLLLTSLYPQSSYPQLNSAISKMVTYFFSLNRASTGFDVRQRPPTIRDLIKWCQRCSNKDLDSEILVLEGLDCFCAHLGKAGKENATKLAHKFNVTSERMFFLSEERSPPFQVTQDLIHIGRVHLTAKTKSNKEEHERPYYMTRPASRLLEFIAMCIHQSEPALIVGETGVGKTSAIQFLAQKTGHEFVAVNLNQQTESCDLIGGIKPVNVEHYVVPLYRDFLAQFTATFDSKANAKVVLPIN